MFEMHEPNDEQYYKEQIEKSRLDLLDYLLIFAIIVIITIFVITTLSAALILWMTEEIFGVEIFNWWYALTIGASLCILYLWRKVSLPKRIK